LKGNYDALFTLKSFGLLKPLFYGAIIDSI